MLFISLIQGQMQSMKKLTELRKSDASSDMHGGERETSELLYLRPELVNLEQEIEESGADQKRLEEIPNIYRGIWWYASFPNHYAGKGEAGTEELGKLVTDHAVNSIVKALKDIKKDTQTLQLQKEYFEDVKKAAKQ